MTNTKAGIPTAKDVHVQMMVNVVIDHKVAYRAYNKLEAAVWIHENVGAARFITVSVLKSRITSGFASGGRVASPVDGVSVFKTKTPSPWRSREYHRPTVAQHRARLSKAYESPLVRVEWRR